MEVRYGGTAVHCGSRGGPGEPALYGRGEFRAAGGAAGYRKPSAGDTIGRLGAWIPRDRRRVVDSLAAHPTCRAFRLPPAAGNTDPDRVLPRYVGARRLW